MEPEINTTKTYLALGDSYTIGQNVCENCRFPAQLKDSLQARYTELDTFNLNHCTNRLDYYQFEKCHF